MSVAHLLPAIAPDSDHVSPPTDADLIRRLRLLASLERYSHGHAKVVYSARFALVVRAIARGAR